MVSPINAHFLSQASLSAALATIFRGKLCDTLFQNRSVATFEKDQVIYDVGDEPPTLFFIRSGFVKIGTVIEDGHELIFEVRGAGDVVGELCASGQPRRDRAAALERAQITAVPFEDVLEVMQKEPDVLRQMLQVLCASLSDAYEQLSWVAFSGTVHRLVKILVRLGNQLGRPSADGTEISTLLTQEEIAQMVAVRRERLSTAMNFLRSRGLIGYSRRGYIVLDLRALENYRD